MSAASLGGACEEKRSVNGDGDVDVDVDWDGDILARSVVRNRDHKRSLANGPLSPVPRPFSFTIFFLELCIISTNKTKMAL